MTRDTEGNIVANAIQAITWAKETSESPPPHDTEELLARAVIHALGTVYPQLGATTLREAIIDQVYHQAKLSSINEGIERHGKKARKRFKKNNLPNTPMKF